jgi:hypothetical protein
MTIHHQDLPSAGQAREALRQKGQFWTPRWVAEAMVGYLLGKKDESDGNGGSDDACSTRR